LGLKDKNLTEADFKKYLLEHYTFLSRPIFIIDGNKKDMLNIGDAYDTYFKGRNSVVLYYTHGHYEVVGVKHSDGSVDTIFTPNHPLIQGCREKIIFNIRPNISSPKYKTSPKVSKTSPK
jgi:hypothetical protein